VNIQIQKLHLLIEFKKASIRRKNKIIMKDIKLTDFWKSYNQKLNKTTSLNNQLVKEINLLKKLKAPKRRAILIGVPYILFLFSLSFIGYKVSAPFVMIGFTFMRLDKFKTILF